MPRYTYDRAVGAAQRDRLTAIAQTAEIFQADSLASLTACPDAERIEVILTGWGSPMLTPAILHTCPSLGLIAHCMGSLRGVVDPALLEHGVRCTNSATQNAVPVAEFLISWVLRWNKQLPYWESVYRNPHADFVMDDRFGDQHAAIGNMDKTVGVIGASRVGRRFMELLRHFDLDVTLADPFVSDADAHACGAKRLPLDALMATSDIVSINAPLLPETRHMIGRTELAAMRDGALLINTARGGLVDHDALLAEVSTGRISAVLDVTEPEPLAADSPFFQLPNVIVTPHVAGSMGTELRRMTENTLDEVALYLAEGRLNHEVCSRTWATAA
ncbi:hydroxyacid dehydrogenase [Acuticoccus sp. MNP-M23]|uniref:hydroxyacid dehydrogenase n=1 Tax=Acuticoccus sp. MNP-M23 TaxID=3072793 RepID=UPI0028150071|nr:hydroxyacid dehydrogenase [Acuticoccus sp. MNP-M23]WMS44571.1 hydroxyacid dehydrogenase [Acuticoccus sp. MNP-M23]